MSWTFGIASDLKVIGACAEFADMSNPRGEIIRAVWFVTAEKDGKVYAHDVPDEWKLVTDEESGYSGYLAPVIGDTGDEAAKAELEVVRASKSNPASNPNEWMFWRTVYGSQAYRDEIADMTDKQRADADRD